MSGKWPSAVWVIAVSLHLLTPALTDVPRKDPPRQSDRRRIVALDFDGVIHSYEQGWTGVTPEDPPTEGAREAIAALREDYQVVVFSTRCSSDAGLEEIRVWLERWEIEVDGIRREKPAAVLVVDDRAFRFGGEWGPVLEMASDPGRLEPWNRRGER